MKIGRNDPCPCGSGKKYKKCCLLTEHPKPVSEPIDEFFADTHTEIRELFQDREFSSLEEANEVLGAHFHRKNRMVDNAFSGL